jgi:hypothetical protein
VPTAVPDGALCLSCNYPLRGLSSGRCPECGRAFDPGEPMTMNLGRPLDGVALALLRPIGRWGQLTMRLLAWAGVLGPAWLAPTNPAAILWLLLWALFILACWIRSVMRWHVVRLYHQPPECLRIDDPFRHRTRRTFALVALLVMTRAPFFVALLVSGPWLDRQAHYVWAVLPADVEPPQTPRMYGLVMVQRTDAGPNYVTFRLLGGGVISYGRSADGQRLEWTWWSLGTDW